MADTTVDITDILGAFQKLLRLTDNGDGTYSVSTRDTGVAIMNSLVPAAYDYISLSYTGANLTGVVFKTGGAGGTTISTLTLAYDGSDNLISVAKS
jgi:hypothetical protein